MRETELEVLKPVFEAEILVLDELGASKPTDWVWDTVCAHSQHALQRPPDHHHYDQYSNLPPLGMDAGLGNGVRGAVREETLGGRIGERMRSRLQEMCVVVEMHARTSARR